MHVAEARRSFLSLGCVAGGSPFPRPRRIGWISFAEGHVGRETGWFVLLVAMLAPRVLSLDQRQVFAGDVPLLRVRFGSGLGLGLGLGLG